MLPDNYRPGFRYRVPTNRRPGRRAPPRGTSVDIHIHIEVPGDEIQFLPAPRHYPFIGDHEYPAEYPDVRPLPIIGDLGYAPDVRPLPIDGHPPAITKIYQ